MAKKIVSRKRSAPGEPPEPTDVTPLAAEFPEAAPESEPGMAAVPTAAPVLEDAAPPPAWATDVSRAAPSYAYVTTGWPGTVIDVRRPAASYW